MRESEVVGLACSYGEVGKRDRKVGWAKVGNVKAERHAELSCDISSNDVKHKTSDLNRENWCPSIIEVFAVYLDEPVTLIKANEVRQVSSTQHFNAVISFIHTGVYLQEFIELYGFHPRPNLVILGAFKVLI